MTKQAHALLGAAALIAAALFVSPRAALAGFCVLCGNNAAMVSDGVVFDELNLNDQLNLKEDRRGDGPAIKEVKQISTGGRARLFVKGDKLSAVVAGGKALEGPDLKDILIVLALKDGREFHLTLASYNDHMSYWASPRGFTPAYNFHVQEIPRKGAVGPTGTALEHPLCEGKFVEEGVNQQPGDEHTAMVFEGDHYDDKHAVSTQEPGWFNLACFGTAAAKMHLLRYTRAGAEAGGGRAPSLERRTTMLRAITADYCGDGRSWTADGTPLVWTEKEQIFPLSVQPDFTLLQSKRLEHEVEAAWGPDGRLLCLNEPRRTPSPPAHASHAVPIGSVGPKPRPCTHPGVRRTDVVAGPIACPNARRLPRCDAGPWSGQFANPWSGAPLATAAGVRPTPLLQATVITVNRPPGLRARLNHLPTRNYCEGISWPR